MNSKGKNFGREDNYIGGLDLYLNPHDALVFRVTH